MNALVVGQNAIGMFIGILFIAMLVKVKTNWLMSAIVVYIGGFCLFLTTCPHIFWNGLDTTIIAAFQALILHSFLYFLLIIIPFIFLDFDMVPLIMWLICLLSLGDAYFIFIKFLIGKRDNALWGLMNNPAMDSAFISCCIPMILDRFLEIKRERKINLIVLSPMFFILIMTKTSTGVLGLGLSVGLYFLIKNKYNKIQILISSLFAASIAVIGWFSQYKDSLIQDSGRFTIWKSSFKFWNNQAHEYAAPYVNRLIGTGPGTFFMYGPNLQIKDAMAQGQDHLKDAFFWMHNIWGQILFETGFIGLFLSLVLYFWALIKSRNDQVIFTMLVLYGLTGCIQMNINHYIFAVLGLCLILQAFKNNTKIHL